MVWKNYYNTILKKPYLTILPNFERDTGKKYESYPDILRIFSEGAVKIWKNIKTDFF